MEVEAYSYGPILGRFLLAGINFSAHCATRP
jgi:hypothetical protein